MFKFKQFTVYHDLCAMKVGTDGVLLGAWADCSGAESILDVGSGSGLVALMLAQRSRALIDAIDIDEGAFQQSTFNFQQSPFATRIRSLRIDYRDYDREKKYDLIVSNPPYFTNALSSPDAQRTKARHNLDLPFELLIRKTVSLLSPHGKFSLIVPYEAFGTIQSLAVDNGLCLIRETAVIPKLGSNPKRILLEYSFLSFPVEKEELIIEISRHVYSEAYTELTKDFYLNM